MKKSLIVFNICAIAFFATCAKSTSETATPETSSSPTNTATVSTVTVSGTNPANGANNVSTTPGISITFSGAMSVTSMTVNSANTQCTASVQVSSDDFATCVRMNATITPTAGNTIFTVSPLNLLPNSVTYKIKVTSAARDAANLSFATTFTSFTTVAATCSDATQNGAETDVDCGGGTCGKCNTNQSCLINSDCVSNTCSGSPKKCT